MKASTVASTSAVAMPNPKSEERTIPSTSPIAQPKRQWVVALNARRLSDELFRVSVELIITIRRSQTSTIDAAARNHLQRARGA